MAFVDQLVMNLLDHDPDECERVLRTTVGERLAANPPPKMDDQINPGVGARSNGAIFREVIDVLARLDGIDVRQTAPVRRGSLHIRPYGEEWVASEEVLTKPLPGINPTMSARAGALDQGDLIPNRIDVDDRGLVPDVRLLADSAIHSITNEKGDPDPRLGIQAMLQALEIHRSGDLRQVPIEGHLDVRIELARGRNLSSLLEWIRQRYPRRAA